MKPPLLAVAAAAETATGLALLLYPPIVIRLLFGAEIADAGIVMSRMAGIALIAGGAVACRPDVPAGANEVEGAHRSTRLGVCEVSGQG